ncbi:hypothetical protein [Rhodocyclus tenuis]|uniref:hypothetical protein n=1 Tax=Rhodocyclus tenuis TaxID=1066 RepID=UPI001903D011|nr:hypothetical protein [Rhodocyclus tenuis]MBK1681721.1 hypothetical protein [Rhodocyclus tenuis]
MKEFIELFFSSTLGGIFALFVLKNWLTARINNSIKSEYDRQLELYKRELDRKQKIDLVAELLAEWIKHPYGEPIPKDQRTKLNKLSFQASLWLPKELAVELNKTLQHRPDSKSIFDILLFARNQLLGDEYLTADVVTFWKPELEKLGDPALSMPNQKNHSTGPAQNSAQLG